MQSLILALALAPAAAYVTPVAPRAATGLQSKSELVASGRRAVTKPRGAFKVRSVERACS